MSDGDDGGSFSCSSRALVRCLHRSALFPGPILVGSVFCGPTAGAEATLASAINECGAAAKRYFVLDRMPSPGSGVIHMCLRLGDGVRPLWD